MKKMQINKTLRLWFLMLFVVSVSVFTGCASSDSTGAAVPDTTITGTAAAGAPVVGYVYVKGSAGNMVSAAIDSNGDYSLDVSTLTAPYIVQAKGSVNGESVEIYSTGVATGNINVTPITNLITSRVLSGLDTAFDSWSTVSSSVDETAIQAAEETVQTQLAPILTAYGITAEIDLMSVDFDTDHSGLDAVLDIVHIEIDGSNNVTITNRATGTSVTGTEAFSDSEGTALVQIVSELAAMNQFWTKMNTALTTNLPTSSELNTDVAPLIADDFIANGRTKTSFLDALVTGNHFPPDITFSAMIDSPMTAAEYGSYQKGYWVNIFYEYKGETGVFKKESMVFDGTNWLWYGNQMWFGVELSPIAFKSVDSSGSITGRVGMRFGIWANDNYAYNTQNVRSVIITGPGIPASGFVLMPDLADEDFVLFNVSPTHWDDVYVFTDDSVLSSISDNSDYTIRAYAETHDVVTTANTALVTYTYTVGKRPHLNTELSLGMFPIITSHTTHAIADIAIGTNITVSWTDPVADTGWIFGWSFLAWSNGTSELEVQKNRSNATDANSIILDTTTNNLTGINWVGLEVNGYDAYKRQIVVEWAFR